MKNLIRKREIHALEFTLSSIVSIINNVVCLNKLNIPTIDCFDYNFIDLGENKTLPDKFLVFIRPQSWRKCGIDPSEGIFVYLKNIDTSLNKKSAWDILSISIGNNYHGTIVQVNLLAPFLALLKVDKLLLIELALRSLRK